MINRRVVLAAHVSGMPRESDFRIDAVDQPPPGEGEVVVRNHYVSVDPGMRGRLSGEASYTAPVPLGDVVGSATVGRVIASNNDAWPVGEWVAGAFGWQELGLSPGGRGIRRIPEGPIPPSAHIGVLGIPGLTAYFGLLDIGQPKPGETVLVSTAAGAVGSAAGQIARINGASTVGIAGGQAKCRWLTEELGFDAAIDRLAEPDMAAAVARECPDGVDVFFDNVGNSLIDPILPLMRQHGRLVISGQTADYNLGREERVGLKNTRSFITARLKMQGLVVFDYAREFSKAWTELTGWIQDGRLKYREDIVDGLESLPAAFVGLFQGQNFGRKLARLVS
ncbi:MAG: 2-alkenal reductase [Caulobacteraceae bacterium]|nr:2-alkenal reductase [Caulobacteraceae bacterium]